MDGTYRGLRCGNDFNLTVQGFSQAIPTETESALNREHGNQKHDDQDHKKDPHRHENTITESRVIGNRNRCATVRTLLQLIVKLPVALRTLPSLHT